MSLLSDLATYWAATPYSRIAAGSGDAVCIKPNPGVVDFLVCFNKAATANWVKLYDANVAPTPGAGTPVQRYLIPGGTAGAGFVIPLSRGLLFSTGIAMTIVTTGDDAGSTGVVAGDVTVNMGYH